MTDAEKIALGDEAKRMLAEGSLFNGLVKSILKEQLSVLAGEDVGSSKAATSHAILKAMEEIKKSLRVLSNEAAVIRKKHDQQR